MGDRKIPSVCKQTFVFVPGNSLHSLACCPPAASGSPSQPNTGKRKKLPVDSVFDKFDDEEADEQPRKRKLVPLDYDDDKSLGVDGAGLSSIKGDDTEEKRKHIKTLIEKIPTAKPELFLYPLDWSMVDTVRMVAFKQQHC